MWSVHSFLLSREKIMSGEGVEEVFKRSHMGRDGGGRVAGMFRHLRKKELSNKFGPHFLAVKSTLTTYDFLNTIYQFSRRKMKP